MPHYPSPAIAAFHARRVLGYLRDPCKESFHPDSLAANVEEWSAEAGLTLVEIGTSSEDLEMLRVAGLKRQAIRRIQKLKDDELLDVERISHDFGEDCQSGKFSYRDVGTSRRKMKLLQRAGWKRNALFYLEELRGDGADDLEDWSDLELGDAKDRTENIRSNLTKAGLTLEEIGVTEAEIALLVKRASLNYARMCLDTLIQEGCFCDYPNAGYDTDFFDALRVGEVTLEDLNVTQAEVDGIVAKWRTQYDHQLERFWRSQEEA